jgi:hypothetical protein
MTVKEMLDKMDSRELSEWMAYSKIENDRMKGVKDPEEVSQDIKKAFTPWRADKGK